VALSPLVAVWPEQYDLYRLLPLTASVLNLALLFWGWQWFGRGYSYWWGLALIALLAVSPLTVQYARILFSEALFLTWTLITILLVERLAARPSPGGGLAAGLAAFGMVSTRSHGFLILAALIFYLALKWRQIGLKPLVLGLIGMSSIVALLIVVSPLRLRDLLPGGYIETFVGNVAGRVSPGIAREDPPLEWFSTRLLSHLDIVDWLPKQIELEVESLRAASGIPGLELLPGILLLMFGVYGGVRWYRQSGITAFNIVVLPFILPLAVWSWDGSRFIYPIQPQLVFVVLVAGHGLVRILTGGLPPPITTRAQQLLAIGALVVLLGASVWVNLRSGNWFLPIENRAVVAAWVLDNTPADSILMSSQPSADYLYTRRRLVRRPVLERGAQDLAVALEKYSIGYVIGYARVQPPDGLGQVRSQGDHRYQLAIEELASQGILVLRLDRPAADVKIYEVNRGALAREH
jgi:hypothetical protein